MFDPFAKKSGGLQNKNLKKKTVRLIKNPDVAKPEALIEAKQAFDEDFDKTTESDDQAPKMVTVEVNEQPEFQHDEETTKNPEEMEGFPDEQQEFEFQQ